MVRTKASETRWRRRSGTPWRCTGPLRAVEGVEFRFHRTVLYNSIYVADDQVLVNTHVYGAAAAQAPVWHLHKLAGRRADQLVPRQLRASLGIGDAS